MTGDNSKEISLDGKSAILCYAMVAGNNPVIEVTLTGASRIILSGNYGPSKTEINVGQ